MHIDILKRAVRNSQVFLLECLLRGYSVSWNWRQIIVNLGVLL